MTRIASDWSRAYSEWGLLQRLAQASSAMAESSERRSCLVQDILGVLGTGGTVLIITKQAYKNKARKTNNTTKKSNTHNNVLQLLF